MRAAIVCLLALGVGACQSVPDRAAPNERFAALSCEQLDALVAPPVSQAATEPGEYRMDGLERNGARAVTLGMAGFTDEASLTRKRERERRRIEAARQQKGCV